MAKRVKFWGPITADATPETVYTNLANTVAKIESVTLAHPTGAAATVIRISVGADGVTTRVLEYSMPLGPHSVTLYPNWNISSTDVVQLSSTVTDDVVVTYGSGTIDVA